jgi:hypothetical protein
VVTRYKAEAAFPGTALNTTEPTCCVVRPLQTS